ncbi:hypothetical protein [Paenibacillus apiarius]
MESLTTIPTTRQTPEMKDVNGDTDAVTESDTPKGTLPQTGEEAPVPQS